VGIDAGISDGVAMNINVSRFKNWPQLICCCFLIALSSACSQSADEQFVELMAAALSGDAEAQYDLALAYGFGRGVPEDAPPQ
jgi:TPR repeat protein